ncbi:MAG: MBL fold metallo-hydrolase [Bacteroidetes bacterium]|nr:MBL fold metallo-hydrolase [Bacteroidota bacterium]
MNRIVKRVLQITGVIIVLLLLVGFGFFLKIRSEIKNMNPVPTGKVVDNVYAIKDSFVNMFLVKDSNFYVAFDAGNSITNVVADLKRLNINPDQVRAILLTHTDNDHVAAIRIFKNAKVYISRPEEQMLNGQKSKFLFFRNHIDAKNYSLVDNQQVLEFGRIKVKGILTEGHTSGSMCFLVDDKYLFTGDVLSLKNGKIGFSVKFFDMDYETAKKSIKNITDLPEVHYIFTSHFGYTADYKNAVRDWKE